MTEELGMIQARFNQYGDMVIQIDEETGVDKTGGHYKAQGFQHDFPPGLSSFVFQIPYPIALLAAEFNGHSSNSGDSFSFSIGENTVIGSLTSDVAVNDTVINVSSTVISNISVGRYLKLDDGINNDESLVIGVDEENSTVTLNDQVLNSYLASTPTYCKMNIKMVENLELDNGVRYELGTSKIGGSYIPANTNFTLHYNNVGGSNVRFKPILEYLY